MISNTDLGKHAEGLQERLEEEHVRKYAELDAILWTNFSETSRKHFSDVKEFVKSRASQIPHMSEEEFEASLPKLPAVRIWLPKRKW